MPKLSNLPKKPGCLLPEPLEAIQNYLSVYKAALIKEANGKNLPLTTQDRFPKLTQAIASIEELKSIDRTINKYWLDLEGW